MRIVDHRVAAISEVMPHGVGQILVLRRRRPVAVALGEAGVEPDDFLQKHQVRLDRLQPLTQVVQRNAPVELRESLVDVVGEDVQRVHFLRG